MTEQELHLAKAINDRLNELKDHLKKVEFVESEVNEGNGVIKFHISTQDEIIETPLKHHLLPIIPDDFMINYKKYLKEEIGRVQDEFDSL